MSKKSYEQIIENEIDREVVAAFGEAGLLTLLEVWEKLRVARDEMARVCAQLEAMKKIHGDEIAKRKLN